MAYCWHLADMPRQPDECQLMGAKRTSRHKAATSDFDPKPTFGTVPARLQMRFNKFSPGVH